MRVVLLTAFRPGSGWITAPAPVVKTLFPGLLLFLLTSIAAIAQNTYPWPQNDSIGIGTTTPAYRLDVNGTFRSAGKSIIGGGWRLYEGASDGNAAYGDIRTNLSSGNSVISAPTNALFFNYDHGTGGVNFGNGQGGIVAHVAATGNSWFGGNVGIGMTGAESKLDINTSTANDGITVRYNNSTYGGFIRIHASSLGSGSWNGITLPGDAGIIFGNGGTYGNSYGNFGFVLAPWYNGYSGLRMDKDGNVGIATSDTKGYRFAVNGDAIFTRIKVKQYGNWPDYVFHATYPLRPLREVEEFIQQHQHLPEMPSAAEVEKNGLDLGDNQALLLKKIEELTLYIIQQDKQMKILKDQLNQQQQVISEIVGNIKKSQNK